MSKAGYYVRSAGGRGERKDAAAHLVQQCSSSNVRLGDEFAQNLMHVELWGHLPRARLVGVVVFPSLCCVGDSGPVHAGAE